MRFGRNSNNVTFRQYTSRNPDMYFSNHPVEGAVSYHTWLLSKERGAPNLFVGRDQ